MQNPIDGKKIAEQILSNIKTPKPKPKLVVILVGDDKPSALYVKQKQKTAERIGFDFSLRQFPADISEKNLISEIKKIQKTQKPDGMIVQLPLPEHLYTHRVINSIDPAIDIDCLTDVNLGKLVSNNAIIEPPTPSAIMAIIDSLRIDLKGKNVVILGTGLLVGKPLAIMMMNRKASVSTCNSSTRDMVVKCQNADIIISGVGKKKLVTKNMVKKGAIVIDAGVSYDEKGKMFGDVDVKPVAKIAKWVTPTPGGVGPITVAKLLENVIKLIKAK